MNTTARLRRAVTALTVAAAATVGLAVASAPAHAAPSPFKFRIAAVHSGLSLTTAGFVGSAVYQDNYGGGPDQQWRLNFTGGSVAQIMNEGSKRCMQPESTGASIVRVMPCDDGPALAQLGRHPLDRWQRRPAPPPAPAPPGRKDPVCTPRPGRTGAAARPAPRRAATCPRHPARSR
jgi:Ricin-type beta-trefoil lectin domain-like